MRKIAALASLLGLVLVIGPALGYVFGSMNKESMRAYMLVGTLIWFVSVPFWMGRKEA